MATEKRLIELIECLEHCAGNTDCESCSRWLFHCDEHCVDDLLATAAKELKKLVAAVEVVRCKDCKHWAYTAHSIGDCKHPRFAMPGCVDPSMEANEFCCLGERETAAAEG